MFGGSKSLPFEDIMNSAVVLRTHKSSELQKYLLNPFPQIYALKNKTSIKL